MSVQSSTSVTQSTLRCSFKPVRGEGREERMRQVVDLLETQITPHYGPQLHMADQIQEGVYKCRLAFQKHDKTTPLGLLVYQEELIDEYPGLGNALMVYLLRANERASLPHATCRSLLLERVISIAKLAKANSICAHVPQADTATWNYFKSLGFQLLPGATRGGKDLLYRETTPSKKRKREDNPSQPYISSRKFNIIDFNMR